MDRLINGKMERCRNKENERWTMHGGSWGAGKCICIECSEEAPRLTADALEQHNRVTGVKIKDENKSLERRQFNCPTCPKEGRGKHVFFKRVPKMKPICKCPKCKKIKDDCERLYPIPKGEEKGYGKIYCHFIMMYTYNMEKPVLVLLMKH